MFFHVLVVVKKKLDKTSFANTVFQKHVLQKTCPFTSFMVIYISYTISYSPVVSPEVVRIVLSPLSPDKNVDNGESTKPWIFLYVFQDLL